MARRNGVLDLCSSVWSRLFSYSCESDEVRESAKLQMPGVREAEFQVGRPEDGSLVTNLTAAVAVTEQEVDVAWLAEVRKLCAEAGPSLLAKMMRVAGPDHGDPEEHCWDLVAEGELILIVRVSQWKKSCDAFVEVALPESHLTPWGPAA
jgi:hypothetical protein